MIKIWKTEVYEKKKRELEEKLKNKSIDIVVYRHLLKLAREKYLR